MLGKGCQCLPAYGLHSKLILIELVFVLTGNLTGWESATRHPSNLMVTSIESTLLLSVL